MITRRHWLAAGGLAITAACSSQKRGGYPGYALIATAGSDSLAVVDLTAFRLAKSIPLGASPTTVIAGDHRSYALTPVTGTIHIVDENLNRVFSQKLADHVAAIHLADQGKMLIALAPDSRELIAVDTATLKVIRRHRLNAEPIAMDVIKSSVVVSTGRHGIVEFIDLQSGHHQKVQMAGEIGLVRFRGDGQMVLVANFHDRSLTALNVPTLETIADLPLAMIPENLCFNADQGQLFVSGPGMDGVAIIFPYRTMQVDQTVLAGRSPGVMACSDTPALLFVASRDGSEVCVLDVDTRKLIRIIEVGQMPHYILITPDDRFALVLNQASGDMAVIHIPAIPTNRMKRPGKLLFSMIPVGEKPVHAAIINQVA